VTAFHALPVEDMGVLLTRYRSVLVGGRAGDENAHLTCRYTRQGVGALIFYLCAWYGVGGGGVINLTVLALPLT
jgi:hypothetical protein